MPSLVDQLREQRAAARAAGNAILTRAAEDPAGPRDLTAEELRDYQARVAEERQADDALEAERDRELAELRAAQVRRPTSAASDAPILTREQSLYDWLQARGAFEPAEQRLSLQRYLRGMATGLGTAPTTSGRWPRPRSAPAAHSSQARSRPA